MLSLHIFLCGALVLFTAASLLRRRLRRVVVDKLPGPPPTSWLTGNLPDLECSPEISDAHFAWTKAYGSVLRIYGEFGRKDIFVSDPKAMHYILNISGYNFPKPLAARAGTDLLIGKGLIWADGTQHARQRKIMAPAFSFNTLREFIPIFLQKSSQTVNKIKEQSGSSESSVIDIVPWLSRTTLDIIGAAAAGYDFQAIEGGQQSKLTEAYSNLMADAFYQRRDIDFVVSYLMNRAPTFIFNLMKRLPTKMLKRINSYMSVVTAVSQDVVDKQTALYTHGKEGSKDLMSVLVRANLSENPKTKLSNEEVTSQLITIFFAGHETTASSLVWTLYELARHPEYQTRVRKEIKTTRARVAERGDGELTISDLDSMPYLQALVKETLRFHPIVSAIVRTVGRDDHIPLSNPIKVNSGEIMTSLPVERGQNIMISFVSYNRLKSVWGEDADVWRPERFLEEKDHKNQIGLGVINNIATFSGGVRSCIGWRFSMLEMQTILIELLENFEFSPPPGNIEILRANVGVMAPMVKGSQTGKTELPLTVTPLQP